MNVKKIKNDQYIVSDGNLELTQTIISGIRFNSCVVKHSGYTEEKSSFDPIFHDLFIALHNFKSKL